MTPNGETTTYTYNSQNELIAESGPSGDYTYTHDALGKVVSSTDDGVVSNYIIDPLAVSTTATGPLSAIAQVYDVAGNATDTYIYSEGPAAEITSAGVDYYNTDAAGDVTSLSGTNGNLVDAYDYTPFGFLLSSSGGLANPFQYSGALGVTTQSNGLLRMGARYYDPSIGRFVSEDPPGVLGGPNTYEYANDDPTVLSDPAGDASAIVKWIGQCIKGQLPQFGVTTFVNVNVEGGVFTLPS